ncbi:MAG: hypothetical protein KF724_13580 [Phycisphaeraceae bacterium]|nr:hypothetical protein [Phycisphaeraceae bacterium]
MVSGLDEVRTYTYSANWQLLEERVDKEYISSPGLNKRVQYVWGLRYIDDCLMHRADLNNDGDYTDSNENTWYHMTDGMFSTVAVLNRTATLVERVSYDSYGQARHHRPGDVNGDGNSGFTDSALVGTIIVANGGTPVPITSSLYRAEADLNRDGTINSSDRTLAGVSASALASGLISNSGTGGPDNSIGWDGYVFNPATGDYLVRHRTYRPTLGRWVERDPVGTIVSNPMGELLHSSTNSGTPGYRVAETDALWADTMDLLSMHPESRYGDGSNLYQYGGSEALSGLDPTGSAWWRLIPALYKKLKPVAVKGGQVVGKKLGELAAKRDSKRIAEYQRKRIQKWRAECEAIWRSYDTLDCRSCKSATSCAEANERWACFAAEVALRQRYLAKRCDYVLQISLDRGSLKAEGGHREQLRTKVIALAICAAKVIELCGECD